MKTTTLTLFLLHFLTINSNHVNCDVFSSTSHLRSLLYLERHLIRTLNDYVNHVQGKLGEVKKYVDEYAKTAGRPEFRGKDESDAIIGNPIQAFQLLKRLTVDWGDLQRKMSEDAWKSDVLKLINEYKDLMPTIDDLRGAAVALVRLTDTYMLNQSDISQGNIFDLQTKVHLTARDCLYLGKQSFNNGYYGQSIEWFEQAMLKASQEGNKTAPLEEIVPFYNMAVEIHDELSPSFWANVSMILNATRPPHTMRFVDGDDDDYRNYQALCRGEQFRTPNQTNHLKCYYSDMGSYWLKIQPIKVEVHNEKPFIAIYHHLLSDSESDAIREMAAPMLSRAKVQTDVEEEISDTRTSQTSWFSEDDHELVARINKRVSEITGLSTIMRLSHSELMQVANYGMGGHYSPHYDYLIVDRPPEERHLVPDAEAYAGDRTATLMFYLSDVLKGGGTAFPRLGVNLKPEKNSAAFWYNLRLNGEAFENTVHGACPVLVGEKWVANHWIREIGQTFRRKCSLNPED